jgi:hypothetical protein
MFSNPQPDLRGAPKPRRRPKNRNEEEYAQRIAAWKKANEPEEEAPQEEIEPEPEGLKSRLLNLFTPKKASPTNRRNTSPLFRWESNAHREEARANKDGPSMTLALKGI